MGGTQHPTVSERCLGEYQVTPFWPRCGDWRWPHQSSIFDCTCRERSVFLDPAGCFRQGFPCSSSSGSLRCATDRGSALILAGHLCLARGREPISASPPRAVSSWLDQKNAICQTRFPCRLRQLTTWLLDQPGTGARLHPGTNCRHHTIYRGAKLELPSSTTGSNVSVLPGFQGSSLAGCRWAML